jgi:hypothetical protein
VDTAARFVGASWGAGMVPLGPQQTWALNLVDYGADIGT